MSQSTAAASMREMEQGSPKVDHGGAADKDGDVEDLPIMAPFEDQCLASMQRRGRPPAQEINSPVKLKDRLQMLQQAKPPRIALEGRAKRIQPKPKRMKSRLLVFESRTKTTTDKPSPRPQALPPIPKPQRDIDEPVQQAKPTNIAPDSLPKRIKPKPKRMKSRLLVFESRTKTTTDKPSPRPQVLPPIPKPPRDIDEPDH